MNKATFNLIIWTILGGCAGVIAYLIANL